MVYERSVRILLDCILVFHVSVNSYKRKQSPMENITQMNKDEDGYNNCDASGENEIPV